VAMAGNKNTAKATNPALIFIVMTTPEVNLIP
jgi:hypothetical protein